MISTPWCRDEIGSLLWRVTQGCAAWHVQVSRITSHDPLWSYTNVLSSHEPFSLVIITYLVGRSVPQIKIFSSSEIGIWIVGYNLFLMLIYSSATFRHHQCLLVSPTCRCLISFALAVKVVAIRNCHRLLRNLLLLSCYKCLPKVSMPWMRVSETMSIRNLSLSSIATIRISWIPSLLFSEKQKNHFKQTNG
jgi:hypothetical protein